MQVAMPPQAKKTKAKINNKWGLIKGILREKKKSRRHNSSRLQTILQSYNNQYNVILVQKETYRPMEQRAQE